MIKSEKTVKIIVAAAFSLLYGWLRFWKLTDSCLWFDEIFSVHAAETRWSDLLDFVARDLIHPPLFYVLLKLWIAAGGDSLIWLRSLPVIFSIAALVPFYFVCRKLKFSRSQTVFAAGLFAVSGCLIKYAQEVRMYSLLMCLALFSMWFFVRFFTLGKSFWLLTAVNILLIYTHYFGWLVIFSEVAAIIVLQRIKINQILSSLAICVAAFAPWVVEIWRAAQINADVSQNLGWAGKPDAPLVIQFVLDLIEPFYYQASSVDAASLYVVTLPMLLVIFGAIAACAVDRPAAWAEEKKEVLLLTIFAAVPIIAAFTASWLLPFSVWGTRHLIIVFPPVMMLAAWAFGNLRFKPLRYALAAALFLLIGFGFWIETRREPSVFIWCGWENLALNLDRNAAQKIYVFEDLIAYHLWFAVRDSDQINVVRVRNVPEMVEDVAYFLPRGFDAVQVVDEREMSGDRFWIAFRDMELNDKHPPLNVLRNRGYKIGTIKSYDANNLKAYLVEVYK